MATFEIETITDEDGNVSFTDETCIHLADLAYTTKQIVDPLIYEESIVEALLMDHWHIDLACSMIAVGASEEVFDIDILDYPNPHERMLFIQVKEVCKRCKRIALTSVSAGTINDPDTPANWIAWAKAKGYKTHHLEQSPMQRHEPAAPATPPAAKPEEPAKPSAPVTDYAALPDGTIINSNDLMQWLDISRMTLNRRIQEAGFPKPFKDGGKNKWHVIDIKQYIASLKGKP